MKHKTFWKEVRRSIRGSLGRFLAIVGIVALGAGFLAGLSATRPVMEASADRYFADTRYMDMKVQSTFGLTEEDIAAMREVEGVSAVEASHQLDLLTTVTDIEGDKVIRFSGLPENMNDLKLLAGRMPESPDECLVNPGKMSTGGVRLGDEITLLEEGLRHKTYKVVGLVNSAQYLSLTLGTTTKGSGTLNYIAYLPLSEFDLPYYTAAYIRSADAEGLSAFTPAYEETMKELADRLQQLGKERSQQRYETMLAEGQAALAKARSQYQEEKKKVEEQLAQAEAELEQYQTEMVQGEKTLADGMQQYTQGMQALKTGWSTYDTSYAEFLTRKENAYASLEEGAQQLAGAQEKIDIAEQQLNEKMEPLEAAKAEIDQAQAKLTGAKEQLDAQAQELAAQTEALDLAYQEIKNAENSMPEDVYNAMLQQWQEKSDQLQAARQELAGAVESWQEKQNALQAQTEEYERAYSELEQAQGQLYAQKEALAQNRSRYEQGRQQALEQLGSAEVQLAELKETLETNETKLAEAKQSIEENEKLLGDVQKKLADGMKELEEGRLEAEKELAAVWAEIEDSQNKLLQMPRATWYVLDRQMDESFVSYASDAERMGKIATVFPWMFFVVAALVSLTTMTRMVEEERQLIGTYKALGLHTGQILAKYLTYAGIASLLGASLGIVLGFQVLPRVVCLAYGAMYMMPPVQVAFYMGKALVAGVLALACTLGATLAACLHYMKSRPAKLMMPEAPKAGKRIWLEHVTPVWRRMSFIRKVTARNLFRYKKRFFMTIIGIAGCTSLLLTGFGLKDSIMDIVENQFHKVYRFDGTLGIEGKAYSDVSRQTLMESDSLHDFIYVYSKMAEVQSDTATVSAYLYVPEDAAKLTEFIQFQTRTEQEAVAFDEDTIVITEKLAERLGVSIGSVISLTDANGLATAFTVGGITENYLFNYVYLPRQFYEQTLGYELNFDQVLFKLSAAGAAMADGAEQGNGELAVRLRAEFLQEGSGIARVQVLDDMIEPVRKMISSLNFVVLVLIVSAGLLAFIVLYNLTNINVTERQRELATIKVLGFHPREVSAYIFRETTVLTVLGCLLGLLGGVVMHQFVITTVEVDMVMFGRSIHAIHYVWAALLTLLFSAVVDLVMHFKLKKISMVESMKSVD